MNSMKTIIRFIPIIGLLLASLQSFAQTITSFTPTSGGPGSVIELTGTNLSGVTGVFFGPGPSASFTINSPTSITATIPVVGAGGGLGPIFISFTGGQTTSAANFNLIPAPQAIDPSPYLITKTQFEAAWNSVEGVSAYFLDVSTSNTFASYLPGYENKAVGNVTTSLVNGLTAGTQYYYRVRSLDLDIIPPEGASNTISITSSATDLTTPLPLPPTLVTTSSFTDNWQESVGATSYYLEVSLNPEFTAANTHTVGSGLSFGVAGIPPGGQVGGVLVYYRVSASNDGGVTKTHNSLAIKMATLPNPIAPGTSQPFANAVNSTTLSLFHQFPDGQPEQHGITGFLWQVATDPDFTQQVSGSPFLQSVPPLNDFQVTGLTPGTKYFYRFAYQCLNGVTDYALTWFSYTIPAAPTLLTTSSSSNSITVTWVATPNASHYLVDVSPDNFVNYHLNAFSIPAATSMTITGLTPGTTYKIRLRAKMTVMDTPAGVDPSDYSNVKTKSTLQSQPIAQATSLNFSAVTSTGMTASYTDAAGGPDGYLVLYKAGSSPTDVPVDSVAYAAGNTLGSSIVAFSGSANTFSPTGLLPGTEYFYDVFAYNGSGNTTNYLTGGQLKGSKFTLSSKPVSQPTAFSVSNITSTSIDVSFAAAAGSPTGYLVLRRAGSAPDVSPADATGYSAGSVLGAGIIVYAGTGTSFSDTGLSPGTLYHYLVFAYNGATNTFSYLQTSPLAGTTSTLSSAPMLATPATSITQSSFQLSWTAVAGATDYALDISTDDFATFVTGYEAKLLGNVTTTSVTGLAPGTNYKGRLRAVSSAGVTASSAAVSALTIPANPVLAAATAPPRSPCGAAGRRCRSVRRPCGR